MFIHIHCDIFLLLYYVCYIYTLRIKNYSTPKCTPSVPHYYIIIYVISTVDRQPVIIQQLGFIIIPIPTISKYSPSKPLHRKRRTAPFLCSILNTYIRPFCSVKWWHNVLRIFLIFEQCITMTYYYRYWHRAQYVRRMFFYYKCCGDRWLFDSFILLSIMALLVNIIECKGISPIGRWSKIRSNAGPKHIISPIFTGAVDVYRDLSSVGFCSDPKNMKNDVWTRDIFMIRNNS